MLDRRGLKKVEKKVLVFLDFMSHPCAGAMLIFSVSFQILWIPTLEAPGAYKTPVKAGLVQP